MIWLHLLIIAVIVCYIVDITGIVGSIKSTLKSWLKIKGDVSLKPFDCSLCMTHWISLIYVLLNNTTMPFNEHINPSQDFIFIYGYILFLSCNAHNITLFLQFVDELINKIINYLWNKTEN